jgi:hypothetical protein
MTFCLRLRVRYARPVPDAARARLERSADVIVDQSGISSVPRS